MLLFFFIKRWECLLYEGSETNHIKTSARRERRIPHAIWTSLSWNSESVGRWRNTIFFGTLRLVWMSPLEIEYPPTTSQEDNYKVKKWNGKCIHTITPFRLFFFLIIDFFLCCLFFDFWFLILDFGFYLFFGFWFWFYLFLFFTFFLPIRLDNSR